MKKLIRMITIGAMALALSVTALAQQPAASPSQDEIDKKAALYEKYTKNYQANNAPLAYAAAKEYVDAYPNDTDDIAKYLRDYIVKYEKLKLTSDLNDLIKAKKWPEAFVQGKKVIADQPNDLEANVNTAFAGWQMAATGNHANNTEATNLATKTIAMVEAVKTFANGTPYDEKLRKEQLAWLNFSLYLYNFNNKMSAAATSYLIKAAEYESPFKSDPNTYLKLLEIYVEEFEKKRLDYAARFDGKERSPEGDAALERVKQDADLLIDTLARALAYSGTDPKTQATRDELKKTLTDYYKFRHGNIDGVDALIAGIKTKPLPRPGPSTPAATPATTSTPAASNSADGTKASSTTPAATGTPVTTTPAKPSEAPKTEPEKKPTT